MKTGSVKQRRNGFLQICATRIVVIWEKPTYPKL
jgi:hypothetical protein